MSQIIDWSKDSPKILTADTDESEEMYKKSIFKNKYGLPFQEEYVITSQFMLHHYIHIVCIKPCLSIFNAGQRPTVISNIK